MLTHNISETAQHYFEGHFVLNGREKEKIGATNLHACTLGPVQNCISYTTGQL